MISFDIEHTRRYIEAKLASTALEYDPFPHIVVEQFFPADLYEQILAVRLSPGDTAALAVVL